MGRFSLPIVIKQIVDQPLIEAKQTQRGMDNSNSR
jgi:hypothetical protein